VWPEVVIFPWVKSKRSFKLLAASPRIVAEDTPARTPNDGVVWAKMIVEKASEQMSRISFLIENGERVFQSFFLMERKSGDGINVGMRSLC
jgi:hypothetical protein